MNIDNYKVTNTDITQNGMQGVIGESLDGSSEENKKRFDQLCVFLINKYNSVLDVIASTIDANKSDGSQEILTAINGLRDEIKGVTDALSSTIEDNKKECEATQEQLDQLSEEVTTATIYYGGQEPSPSLGKNGDIYFKVGANAIRDYYIPSEGRWFGDGAVKPDGLTSDEEYDWEIEHGWITEAKEEWCKHGHAWAKYGYCPVCGEKVWVPGDWYLQWNDM